MESKEPFFLFVAQMVLKIMEAGNPGRTTRKKHHVLMSSPSPVMKKKPNPTSSACCFFTYV